jgi:phosphotransacetylase/acyl dehydratase
MSASEAAAGDAVVPGRASAAVTDPLILVIKNRTFDEIVLGERATLQRTLSREDIELFAVMSGDVNPAHVDEEYAHSDMFHEVIAHGLWGASLISTLLGTQLPGPGTIYLEQTLRFRRPVTIGDTVTVSVTAAEKEPERHRIAFDCRCVNQRDEVVIEGTAMVIAPTEKVSRPRVVLPEVTLHDNGARLRELIARAREQPPIRMAVVHPVDADVLLAAVQAAQDGLIDPVLIGPEDRIRATAAAHEITLDGLAMLDTEHSHAAADTAIRLARGAQVDAIMRGSQDVEELLHTAVAPRAGLTTDRRMTHAYLMDVPTYPRPLIITDAGINIDPDLETKRDIVQNAIDLALAVGIPSPRVAILSSAETVNPKLRSSLDAAALAKMAERGQIRGGIVDGALGFDMAVSAAAARVKGIASPVAGRADVIVVPDLESGSLLVKQLGFLGDSHAAGIALGGRVPIVLNGRTATVLEQLASCALASLVARARHADA